MRAAFKAAFLVTLALYVAAYPVARDLKAHYRAQASATLLDRNGAEIAIEPNEKGHYARFTDSVPPDYAEKLLAQEDRFFFLHPGVNPWSILRSAAGWLVTRRFAGSSTITQQVVKLILGNENDRTWANKIKESLMALALELYTSKREILAMHANLVYFGDRSQGITEASKYLFDRSPAALERKNTAELIAAVNRPMPSEADAAGYTRKSDTAFELDSLGVPCSSTCQLTIDADLTERLREILRESLTSPDFVSAENGAIVVIRTPRTGAANELLAIVGSAAPHSSAHGSQIDMAVEPRPIGSTAKPFIYLKAFEAGARPYTLVDDTEYHYTIGTGFPFYPKNYDGKFRGTVTLREALANSLNVPSVKVLEFVGIDRMADLLETVLGFQPIQPLETYGLGIALGALEADLLTLTNYFTIFPNDGMLRPLQLQTSPTATYETPPMASPVSAPVRVAPAADVALVRSIITERESGVDQFGIKSSLNIPSKAYGVKTGTSRDYHDSWTIGFTPDFTVGVWIGNSENTAMQQLSGQMGAGLVWHKAMEMLLNSPYNTGADFPPDELRTYEIGGTLEYGLAGDPIDEIRTLLKDTRLILSPHDGDTFLLESGTTIPFHASDAVAWYVNDMNVGSGADLDWKPDASGAFTVAAESPGGRREAVTISIVAEESTLAP